MKIDDYYVTWRYEDDFIKINDILKVRNATSCIIKDKDKIEIGVGKIILNHLDIEDKETARKISFGRAIMVFPKWKRIKFWEAFRTMTKTPKWTTTE